MERGAKPVFHLMILPTGIDICADCIFSGQLLPAYAFATVNARPNSRLSITNVHFLSDLFFWLRGSSPAHRRAKNLSGMIYRYSCVFISLIHLTAAPPAPWSRGEGR